MAGLHLGKKHNGSAMSGTSSRRSLCRSLAIRKYWTGQLYAEVFIVASSPAQPRHDVGDLQWADAAMLVQIASRLRSTALLIVGAYRAR
jgi:hypothetical protein